VSEGDLFLDERTGVTYRVVLERQDGRIAMKLVPAFEQDKLRLVLSELKKEGFNAVDLSTVEKDGVRYRVEVVEQDGKYVARLTPYPEDLRKAVERETWWELWRQGFVKRGEYAVKDGVKYKVEVVEQDGKYVVKLTPVGPASPDEEPRRYRRGDQRGSLDALRQIQFTIDKLKIERIYTEEELADLIRFGVVRERSKERPRPEDLPYIPVVDEIFYGAFGMPLSQTLYTAGRTIAVRHDPYWSGAADTWPYRRYTTSTLPGPRVEGLTWPERRAAERFNFTWNEELGEIQRLYAEKFRDVWTPLTLRAPTAADVNWRTAVATAAETLTFWIPVTKGAAALAAARGLRIPALTAEKTVAAGRVVRLPRVSGDYFEVHYVEPRALDEAVRVAFVGYGVGKGVAVRGRPGNLQFAFARFGQPAPGWAFEWTAVTYRDVADWLKKIPSVGIDIELRPKTLRFTEVWGFARDVEPPKFEPPRIEPPHFETPRGRPVEVKWAEPREVPKPPEAQPPRRAETPRGREAPQRGPGQVAVQQLAGKAVEELAPPVRVQVPVAVPVKTQAPVAVAAKAEERTAAEEPPRAVRQQAAELELPLAVKSYETAVRGPDRAYAELPLYVPTWHFAAPLTYQQVAQLLERPASVTTYEAGFEALEREIEATLRTAWTADEAVYRTRTATTATRASDSFYVPPPPPVPYTSGAAGPAAGAQPTCWRGRPGLRAAAGGCTRRCGYELSYRLAGKPYRHCVDYSVGCGLRHRGVG